MAANDADGWSLPGSVIGGEYCAVRGGVFGVFDGDAWGDFVGR